MTSWDSLAEYWGIEPGGRKESGAAASIRRPGVKLHFLRGPCQGQTTAIDDEGLFIVGRSKQAAVSLGLDESAPHLACIIEISAGEQILHVIGAMTVNGESATSHRLATGDVLSIGQTKIELELTTSDSQKSGSTTSSFDDVLRVAVGNLVKSTGAESIMLPGYVLGSEIGKGRMGTVYLARVEGSREKRAIKVAHTDTFDDERTMQLFLREASILSQLQHKRIVRFFEVASIGRQFYIVMEYVPTISLDELFASLSPASRIRTACLLTSQVLEGLKHAHELGLVHRDIKPTNILVSRKDRKLSTKLADFGLAKSYLQAGGSGITRTGELRGTLDYMAPEQLRDPRAVGPAADVYSLGASLYALIAGRVPLARANQKEAIQAILDEEPTPLNELVPETPAALSRFLEQALAKNPEERFPSAREMRRALTAVLSEIG